VQAQANLAGAFLGDGSRRSCASLRSSVYPTIPKDYATGFHSTIEDLKTAIAATVAQGAGRGALAAALSVHAADLATLAANAPQYRVECEALTAWLAAVEALLKVCSRPLQFGLLVIIFIVVSLAP